MGGVLESRKLGGKDKEKKINGWCLGRETYIASQEIAESELTCF